MTDKLTKYIRRISVTCNAVKRSRDVAQIHAVNEYIFNLPASNALADAWDAIEPATKDSYNSILNAINICAKRTGAY